MENLTQGSSRSSGAKSFRRKPFGRQTFSQHTCCINDLMTKSYLRLLNVSQNASGQNVSDQNASGQITSGQNASGQYASGQMPVEHFSANNCV
jgi:hypothetical protein